MCARMRPYGAAYSNQSVFPSCCRSVTIDWTKPSDGERYRFIRDLAAGDGVVVTNGDNRLRSAVHNLSSGSREHRVSKVDGGLLVERLS